MATVGCQLHVIPPESARIVDTLNVKNHGELNCSAMAEYLSSLIDEGKLPNWQNCWRFQRVKTSNDEIKDVASKPSVADVALYYFATDVMRSTLGILAYHGSFTAMGYAISRTTEELHMVSSLRGGCTLAGETRVCRLYVHSPPSVLSALEPS